MMFSSTLNRFFAVLFPPVLSSGCVGVLELLCNFSLVLKRSTDELRLLENLSEVISDSVRECSLGVLLGMFEGVVGELSYSEEFEMFLFWCTASLLSMRSNLALSYTCMEIASVDKHL